MAVRDDEIARILRLDTARSEGWRRVQEQLDRRRERLVHDLVRGSVADHYQYHAIVGELRGLDCVLAAIKKEFVTDGRS
jgi:hypothetical protein